MSTQRTGPIDGADAPRLPALTGLRIFAALAVYASHIGPPRGASKPVVALFEAGYMGVTLFFVLSGFVLAINYFDAMRRPSARATWQFAVARFARIYPLYILVLLYILVRRHAFVESTAGWWQHVLAIQAWNPDVFQAFNFNGPGWSVCVEVFLYACFPLLVPLLARVRTPRATLTLASAVVLAMTALATWFVATGRGDLSYANPGSAHRWLYVTPLPRLGDFLLGILAARLYMQTRAGAGLARAGGPLAIICVAAILALMAWPANLSSAWSWDVAYAVPSAVLIFALASTPRGALARVLSLPLLILLGESSYAFYLVHRPALGYLDGGRWRTVISGSTVIFELLTLLAILCLAMGLHVAIERPARIYVRRLLGSDSRRGYAERVAEMRSAVAATRSALLPRLRTRAVAFVFAFTATLIVALLHSPKIFYYDAGGYWDLGQTFTRAGHFSLLNFNSPLRGYLLPLIDHLLQQLAVGLAWNYSSAAKLFNALIFALIGSVLAPQLAQTIWPALRWGAVRRVGLTVLLLIFWNGYLDYPLSDFPALAAALLALVAIARCDRPGWMLVAGLTSAAAIEMRPSYLVLAPTLLLLVAWRWLEQRGQRSQWRLRSLCVALLIAGFVLIALPQSLSSHRYFATWSFVPGAAAHLTSLQFTEGMRLQRYETYVGADHHPRMLYTDPSGSRLLDRQHDHTVETTGEYLGLVVTHPITMAGVFVRHLVNGFDQRYSTPYVGNLDTGSQRWLRLGGFLLTFLALVRVLWAPARRRLGPARGRYAVALAFCCITSIPSAVEPRYFLPGYLLGYMLVLLPGWPTPIERDAGGVRRYRTIAALAIGLAVFLGTVIYITGQASGHLQFGAV